MKVIRDKKFQKGLLAVAMSTALVGCNWSDDDDSGPAATGSSGTTTFNVNLGNAPTLASTAFDWSNPLASLMSKAYADTTDLTESAFKVLIVDADGVVKEVIELTADQVQETSPGVYAIYVPGDPRLDCVIAVDTSPDGELIVNQGQSLAATGALFTPTTARDINLDLESSFAYQQFLNGVDSFDGYDVSDSAQVAAVEQLVNNVEQALENSNLDVLLSDPDIDLNDILLLDPEDPDIPTELADLSTLLNDQVQSIIEDQVALIESSVEVTIVSLFGADGAGLFWFDSEVYDDGYYLELDELEYGNISPTNAEAFYEYEDGENGEEGSWELQTAGDDDLVLTSEGWVHTSDSLEFVSRDEEEGTVLIQDSAQNQVQLSLGTLQALDLEGLNIENFLKLNADEEGLSVFIPSDAEFGEGATAIKISSTIVNENYFVWYDSYGETGEAERLNLAFGPSPSAFTLDDIVTNTAATVDDIGNSSTAISIAYENDMQLVANLVEVGGVRTAQFFTMSYGDEGEYEGPGGPEWVLYSPSDSSSSTPTWSVVTPEGLGEDEEMIQLPIPADLVKEFDLDGDESTRIFVEMDDYIATGSYVAAGQKEDAEGEWVFNKAAADDILESFDDIYFDVFFAQCQDEESPEFEFDDLAYNGIGVPVDYYTKKSFLAAIPMCDNGIASEVTEELLTSTTLYEGASSYVFNVNNAGVHTGVYTDVEDGVETEINFNWAMNSDSTDGIPNGLITITYSPFTATDDDGSTTANFVDYYAPLIYEAGDQEGEFLLELMVFTQADVWFEGDGADIAPIPAGTGERRETQWDTENFQGQPQ